MFRRFLRRPWVPLAIICWIAAIGVALAACGGSPHRSVSMTGPTGQTGVTSVDGHPCDPRNQVMQCVLPPAPASLPRAVSPVLHGIDFAWSCPSPAGQDFGMSYASNSSKDWTLACLGEWHRAGKATGSVWETAGNRALDGCAAGAADARSDAAELARDGAPANSPVRLAIDFDASGPDVAPYFECADRAEPGRVNAYGGAGPITYLHDHFLVGGLNWCSYAWLYRTGGVWPSPEICPLRQVLNGSSVDYDQAVAPYFGQWPYRAPKPPGPSPQVKRAERARDANLAIYHRLHCTMAVLGAPYKCRLAAAYVISWQQQIPGPRPVCWGRHAQVSAPVCQIVRSEVNTWSKARQSSYAVARRIGCYEPSGDSPKNTPPCRSLFRRANYFNAKADALFRAWL